MPTSIKRETQKQSKNRRFPGIVIEVVNGRASVYQSGSSRPLHNLPVTGGPVQVGDKVDIDWSSGQPIVMAYANAVMASSSNSRSRNTSVHDDIGVPGGDNDGMIGSAPRHNHILDSLLPPTQATALNATAAMHGLLPKLSGNANDILRGDGTWGTIGATSGSLEYFTSKTTYRESWPPTRNCLVMLSDSSFVLLYYNYLSLVGTHVVVGAITDGVISLGTPVQIAANGTTAIGLALLDGTHVAIYHQESSGGQVCVGTVSGDAITLGADNAVGAQAYNWERVSLAALDSTHIVVGLITSGTAPAPVNAIIGTVSGDGIIFGSLTPGDTSFALSMDLIQLAPTQFAASYKVNHDSAIWARTCLASVSGATITWGTPQELDDMFETDEAETSRLTSCRMGNQRYLVAFSKGVHNVFEPNRTNSDGVVYLCSGFGGALSVSDPATFRLGFASRITPIMLDNTHFVIASDNDDDNNPRSEAVTGFIALNPDSISVDRSLAQLYDYHITIDLVGGTIDDTHYILAWDVYWGNEYQGNFPGAGLLVLGNTQPTTSGGGSSGGGGSGTDPNAVHQDGSVVAGHLAIWNADKVIKDGGEIPSVSSNWLNIMDYGAVADGTTDDSAAFTALWAAMISEQKPGWVPQGTYRITTDLTLGLTDQWGMHFICEGKIVLGTNGGANHRTLTLQGFAGTFELNRIEGGTLAFTGTICNLSFNVLQGLDKTTDGLLLNGFGNYIRFGGMDNCLNGLHCRNFAGNVLDFGSSYSNANAAILINNNGTQCGENRFTFGSIGDSYYGIAFGAGTAHVSQEGNIFSGAIFQNAHRGVYIIATTGSTGFNYANTFNIVSDNYQTGADYDIWDDGDYNVFNLYWARLTRCKFGAHDTVHVNNAADNGLSYLDPARFMSGWLDHGPVTAAPDAPATGRLRMYVMNKDGIPKFYTKDELGNEVELGGGRSDPTAQQGDMMYRASAAPNLIDYAAGKTPVESGHYSSYTSANITDGNPATFWIAQPNGHTGDTWAAIDLGDAIQISGHHLVQVDNGDGNEFATTYRVFYSQDNVHWTQLDEFTAEVDGDETIVYDHPIVARYWNVQPSGGVASDFGWKVYTFEVLGPESPTGLLRLPIGNLGEVLKVVDDGNGNKIPGWDTDSGGLVNPMTTAGDMIVGGVDGAPERTGIGDDSQVWTIDPATHLPAWKDPTGGSGGGTPGDTVVEETSFGQSSSAGVSTAFSRADHTHGTPASPTLSGAYGDHSVSLYLGADQSIASTAGGVTISWDQESYDTDAFHSTSVNTSRVTIPSGLSGKYRVSVSLVANNSGSGTYSGVRLKKNGTAIREKWWKPTASSGWESYALSAELNLTATDYLEVIFEHDVGTGRDVVAADAGAPLSWLDVSLIEPSASGSMTGWIDDTGHTWTYVSADGNTGVANAPYDATGTIGLGWRLKYTQGGSVKYGIVTAVGGYADGVTPVTFWGGTDYTFANAVVSGVCFSPAKAPLRFPLDPSKWTVRISDSVFHFQTNPQIGVWYNFNNIVLPIGSWNVAYWADFGLDTDAGVTDESLSVTLSTANNSESDKDLTARWYRQNTVANMDFFEMEYHKRKTITVGAKTIYYLNAKSLYTVSGSIDNNSFQNSDTTTIIEAVSAYL